ncbi:MAG TPA: gamma carbonic anhydrase family protein [Gemmatimonadales bacterium]|nr:gamma carbonic anhydrase family protein [Gemmatimonadales bacterium]
MDPAGHPPRSPVVHPTAFVAPGADVLGDVRLGPEASVWYQCVLRGDMAPITVGARSNIQDLTMVHVDEGVPCTIGAGVGVGHRCILHGCTIEDDCLIGMGSILLNGVHVGTGSVIGAGAVVPEGMRIPAGSLVMGVPAKVRRPVDDELRARIRLTVEHYVHLARAHAERRFARPER